LANYNRWMKDRRTI